MRNLTPYAAHALNESVESGPMGFVISFNAGSRNTSMSYTLAGVFDTFYEFANAVNNDIGISYASTTDFKDLGDLMEHVFSAMDIVDSDYSFWHGFKVKPGASGYHSESNMNCYLVADMLEKLFVNPRAIMTSKDPVQNSFDLKYISRSIERDPGKLAMYDDDEDDNEMYHKILRLLNWDKRKIDALITVSKIKNQF
jgi:hypothetical protein